MTLTVAHVAMLSCPVCREGMAAVAGGLRCPQGHHFDASRHGSVTLLPRATRHRADDASMIAARERWLASGHYRPIANHCRRLVGEHHGTGDVRHVVDIGGGTGWWLAELLDAWPAAVGLTLDLSDAAVRRAARAHVAGAAVRADLWQDWPLRDACVDVAVTVFSPRNPGELARVLRTDGVAIVVTPAAEHLAELREDFGLLSIEAGKRDRLMEQFSPHLSHLAQERYRSAIEVSPSQIADLVAMGPSAHHRPTLVDESAAKAGPEAAPASVSAAGGLGQQRRNVTIAVTFDVFRRRPDGVAPTVG